MTTWAEFIIPETAQALASYEHPFYGRFPAITRNQHGRGTLTYEGTLLSDKLAGESSVRSVKPGRPDGARPADACTGQG